jgi:hypothetical protein|nr:MAG TPA: hypothetical protein [Caudoviricetes sp.]DAV03149.1 MAG TPA: hypothetical protein [Caudoviricetes sp.]
MVNTTASGKSAGTAVKRNGSKTFKNERRKMKVFVEIALIWGIVLAFILAVFLLNFWLVHHIELLVGAKVTWYIIGVGALMTTGWIFRRREPKNTEEKA